MKTGIVLEGGALRTIFSSGVTDGLLRGGVDFSYVIGVSAGIAYGVSYLLGRLGRLEILTQYANDKRYMSKRNLLRRAITATLACALLTRRSQTAWSPLTMRPLPPGPGKRMPWSPT